MILKTNINSGIYILIKEICIYQKEFKDIANHII